MKAKDVLGLVGGILGALYATGYLVAAGHARILGLPVRSTDPAPLLGAAWEFLVRGSVIFVLRTIESLTVGRTLTAVLVAGIAIVLGASANTRTRLLRAIEPLGRVVRRRSAALILCSTLGITGAQVWHVAAQVIPTSAVSSLLFNRITRSPFVGPSQGYFDARWDAVQKDLLGDGTRGHTRNLSRRYVIHVMVTVGSALAAWLLWRSSGHRKSVMIRVLSATPMVLASFLVVYTPLCYGALLKSYQYPVVNIIGADGYSNHPNFAAELRVALSHSRFLLDTTAADLYLFDPQSQELHVLARDKVAMIKVIAEDFVFRATEE